MTKNNSKPQREYRKDQAQARQAERRGRTDAEQIALLDTRPGQAKRERARLVSE